MYIRLIALSLLAAGSQAAELKVTVHGLQQADGKVLVAAYDRAETFLKQPVAHGWADAKAGSVEAVLSNLPAGDYAISLYQDRNSNQQLDSNLLGMPTEPYGFSNDATGNFGPPSFAQARIHLPEAGSSIAITLR